MSTSLSPESKNPLPRGEYFIAVSPERAEDFTDWARIYFPQRHVTLLTAVPQGSQVFFTFRVETEGTVIWWANLFGLPSRISPEFQEFAKKETSSEKTPLTLRDAAKSSPVAKAGKELSELAEQPAKLEGLAMLAVAGVLLYLYLQPRRDDHAVR